MGVRETNANEPLKTSRESWTSCQNQRLSLRRPGKNVATAWLLAMWQPWLRWRDPYSDMAQAYLK